MAEVGGLGNGRSFLCAIDMGHHDAGRPGIQRLQEGCGCRIGHADKARQVARPGNRQTGVDPSAVEGRMFRVQTEEIETRQREHFDHLDGRRLNERSGQEISGRHAGLKLCQSSFLSTFCILYRRTGDDCFLRTLGAGLKSDHVRRKSSGQEIHRVLRRSLGHAPRRCVRHRR